jgi:hypothetical protein
MFSSRRAIGRYGISANPRGPAPIAVPPYYPIALLPYCLNARLPYCPIALFIIQP